MPRRLLKRAGITEPAKYSPYRHYFDRSQHPAESLSIALSARFHTHRERLHTHLRETSKHTSVTPDMVMDVGEQRSIDLTRCATRADEIMGTISGASYQNKSRVRMHTIFSSPLLFLPLLFKFSPDNAAASNYRRQLIDGVYTDVAEYAAFLLNTINDERSKSRHIGRVIGALGEVVALGVGNRAQSAERCYLPSLHLSDMQGIDIDYLGYAEAAPSAHYTGIQVKAYNVGLETKQNQPPGTCILDSYGLSLAEYCPPFHKGRKYLSAQAMALEVNGEGDTPLGHHDLSAEAGLDMLGENIAKIALDHSITYPATFAK